MKTILAELSNEQAQKEVPKFTWLGLIGAAVGVFVLPVIGTLGIAFCGRSLLLTFHKGNKTVPKLWLYRVLSVLGFVLGWFDVVYMLYGHK